MKHHIIKAFVATSLTILAGCATQQKVAQNGDAGWVRWEKSAGGNGHYYKAVAVTNGITWPDADLLARAEGGYLATITSSEENTFVCNLVNAPEFFTAPWGDGPALGGYQLSGSKEPDGGWCWVTGEPWNYTNWEPGQPDNLGPRQPDNLPSEARLASSAEDRLELINRGRVPGLAGITWNDRSRLSSRLGGYVIERDK